MLRKPMIGPTAWVVALIVQRLGELVWSRRNERRMIAAGGHRCEADRYGEMVLFHSTWLAALLMASRRPMPPKRGAVVSLLFGQTLRYWCIHALGERWCTRVVVVPGRPLVRTGPYRWLRHPNYVAVTIEILAAPLVVRRRTLALVGSVANAVVLRRRIRVEEACLGERLGPPRFAATRPG